jgi:hypothetical protein
MPTIVIVMFRWYADLQDDTVADVRCPSVGCHVKSLSETRRIIQTEYRHFFRCRSVLVVP